MFADINNRCIFAYTIQPNKNKIMKKIRLYVRLSDNQYVIKNETTEETIAIAFDNLTAEFIRFHLQNKLNK